ncbi:hypothetical protein [Pseudosulfitobacter sp. DSM 107133]|jgi:hypothetical protein|uniref:hypothetical protein n=1 Tax=Pseudosulfitobacter sp. DSM 107133 TaxID=2883100 RepID=UPI0019648B59|nr:hypothetical protein [Pseudosulfitobacter sp. DSM 107133]UOA25764.1 hypothetical protein DSM107133_00450 [Pseudosulfitobacter sp. DSM 107133]
MIRAIAFMIALAALAACDPATQADAPHDHQQPSATEPGLRVSGFAKVGVVKTF